MTDQELIDLAANARRNAHVPYSRFAVGAAALAASGKVYTGVNIENASLGLTVCAERVAIFAAVAAGCRNLTTIAISCPAAAATSDISQFMPCGACRQVMAEFGRDDTRILVQGIAEFRLGELLKSPFRLQTTIS